LGVQREADQDRCHPVTAGDTMASHGCEDPHAASPVLTGFKKIDLTTSF